MTIEIVKAKDLPSNPVPSVRHQYPFDKMSVGDAFFLPADHNGSQLSGKCKQARVYFAAANYARRHGWKFVTREQKCGGVRVERIK